MIKITINRNNAQVNTCQEEIISTMYYGKSIDATINDGINSVSSLINVAFIYKKK